jgi:hypothetical protein
MSQEFWWDELERCSCAAALPSTLKIRIGDGWRMFEPGRAAEPAKDMRGEISANRPGKPAQIPPGFLLRGGNPCAR